MMKKVVYILIITIALCFSACQNNSRENEEITDNEQTQTTKTENQSSSQSSEGYFNGKNDELLLEIAKMEFEQTVLALQPFELGGFPMVFDDTVTDDDGKV